MCIFCTKPIADGIAVARVLNVTNDSVLRVFSERHGVMFVYESPTRYSVWCLAGGGLVDMRVHTRVLTRTEDFRGLVEEWDPDERQVAHPARTRRLYRELFGFPALKMRDVYARTREYYTIPEKDG